jgi:serine/threonine protein kinase/DNA polymerase III delta prime subunit
MDEHVGHYYGNYRLIRLLGHGGFADVYLGEHIYLEIHAAIKVLHVRMDQPNSVDFLREARLIAHLEHPHIVRVLEFGIDGSIPFLVMQYAPKGTLRSLHPRGTRLPLEQIIPYVRQIALALQYAHEQRIIHRDVKPENMLVGANNEVLLTDFGLAVIQQSAGSLVTQNQAGTALYMAPEQIMGKPSPASDQYALGIVVYEWLCGAPPFRGSAYQVWAQHVHRPPPSLCEQVPTLPRAVEDAVLVALAKDPQQRFVSVRDFADVLEEASSSTQPLPVPPSPAIIRSERPSQDATLQRPAHPQALQAQDISSEQTLPRSLSPTKQVTTEPVLTPVERKNRQRLLAKVHAFWIKGVLEQSLYGQALITLGLCEQAGAVANPWELVLQQPEASPSPLPAGTTITQVYDDAGGELLILGAPGSGKTTLLLELARNLLDRAQHNDTHPLPVVFNLASWAGKRQPITDWLVEELNSKYQVPTGLGRHWVSSDQVLPLLDGLDEVTPAYRTACIEAINSYWQEHGLVSTVVCSRSADYLAQPTRLLLGHAIVVQPLKQQQIDQYLASAGEQLAAVRVALRTDPVLGELATTPLMLSVLALAYYGISSEALLRAGRPEMRRRQIFEQYVQRMLQRRGRATGYTPQQTISWLSWLARQLAQHNQTEFYLERMQPDWLSKRWSLSLYRALALGSIDGLIGLLLSWLIGGLTVFHIGLLTFGLIGLLTGILLSGRTAEGQPGEPIPWSWRSLVKIKHLRNGLGTGLVIGLIIGLVNDFPLLKDIGVIAAGADVLVGGLIGALTGVLSSVLIRGRTAEIQPTELITWSWRNFMKIDHLRRGLDIGLVVGLVNLLIYAQISEPLSMLLHGLTYMLLGLFFSTLVIGLFGGLSSEMVDEHSRVKPNEGMRRSARNSRMVGLTVGVLFGLVSGLCLGLFGWWSGGWENGLIQALIYGIFYGLVSGLLSGLLFGGEACIRHSLLRLFLWLTRSTPWNYPRFLDYATERILLHKVGGSYIFIHRLLLDYFVQGL